MKYSGSAQEVVDYFERFYAQLIKLDKMIEKTTLPFKVLRGQQFISDRSLLRYTINHLSADKGLSTIETYKRPGVVASTPAMIKQVVTLNQAKQHIKASIKAYQQAHKQTNTAEVRHLLAQAGYGLVRLKEVYRQYIVIVQQPTQVTWFQSKHYSSVKLSRREAKDKLLAYSETAAIDLQLKRLAQLPRKEHLVVRHAIDPIWYANLVLPSTNEKSVIRTVKTSIPLFYLHDAVVPLPLIQYRTVSPRRKRKDCRVSNEPYLPILHAYAVRDM